MEAPRREAAWFRLQGQYVVGSGVQNVPNREDFEFAWNAALNIVEEALDQCGYRGSHGDAWERVDALLERERGGFPPRTGRLRREAGLPPA